MSLRGKLVDAFEDYWSAAGYGGLAEDRAEDNADTAMPVVAPLEAIVRDLAASDPAGEDFGAGPECVLCPANNLPVDRRPSLDDHDPSCPWRRAVEWVRDTDQETT